MLGTQNGGKWELFSHLSVHPPGGQLPRISGSASAMEPETAAPGCQRVPRVSFSVRRLAPLFSSVTED